MAFHSPGTKPRREDDGHKVTKPRLSLSGACNWPGNLVEQRLVKQIQQTRTMRLLLLHTDEAIRTFMPEIVRAGLAEAFKPRILDVQSEDGRNLTYERTVDLLKE